MFTYPKKAWQLPCKYHTCGMRYADNTPVVLTNDIVALLVSDYVHSAYVTPLDSWTLKRLSIRQLGVNNVRSE